jgi:hypothetical protein
MQSWVGKYWIIRSLRPNSANNAEIIAVVNFEYGMNFENTVNFGYQLRDKSAKTRRKRSLDQPDRKLSAKPEKKIEWCIEMASAIAQIQCNQPLQNAPK